MVCGGSMLTDDDLKRIEERAKALIAELESMSHPGVLELGEMLDDIEPDVVLALIAEVRRLDAKWTNLLDDLRKREEALAPTRHALCEMEADRDRQRAALEKAEAEVATLKARVDELHDQRFAEARKCDDLRAEVGRLTEALADRLGILLALTDERDSLRDEVVSLKAEVERLLEPIQGHPGMCCGACAAAVGHREEAINWLGQEYVRLSNENSELRRQLADAARELNVAGPVDHRIRIAKAEWSKALQDLEANRDRLLAERDEALALLEQVKALLLEAAKWYPTACICTEKDATPCLVYRAKVADQDAESVLRAAGRIE